MKRLPLSTFLSKSLSHGRDFWAIAFLLLALISSLRYAGESPFLKYPLTALIDNAIHQRNWSADKDKRFATVKTLLPMDAIVGYTFKEAEAVANSSLGLFQAQYTLAPIRVHLLGSGSTPDMVIGEFNTAVDLDQLCAEKHLTVVRDFGNGVVLFRRATPIR
jgi:hypothetical protein